MDDWLTTREVAEMLGVGTTSVKRWSEEGRLRAFKTAGGHRRYRRVDIARILQEQEDDGGLHTRLPAMSRRDIDALSVGVIQLSDDGMVLLYSAAESGFSGIAVAEAEGQNFFTELAPCTNNSILYGRFRDGVKSGELDLRVNYTFTYRMRPTFVALHLYRDSVTATNWLLVEPQS